MPDFSGLSACAAAWFLIHPGIAGSPVRGWVVRGIGERAFRAGFAMLSLAALSALIWSYSRAPFYPLWFAPRAIYFVPLVLVPLGFVLLVGSFTVRNPTVVMGERALQADEPARGALRITRHPFLWGVLLWGVAHVLVNGDVASILFFGSLALTALVGTFDIDRKRGRTQGEAWQAYRAVTSNLPFAAVAQGRNRLIWLELWLPAALGVALSLALLHFHAGWFGASPLP
jgi:uncharacterized membrane protein